VGQKNSSTHTEQPVEGGESTPRPGRFTSEKVIRYPFYKSWVGLGAGLDRSEKIIEGQQISIHNFRFQNRRVKSGNFFQGKPSAL
jgi:hypothetical protein